MRHTPSSLNWVKLCKRPEVNNEPPRFLTFINNGIAYPSSRYWKRFPKGIGFLETFRIILVNTKNNMKSKTKNVMIGSINLWTY